MSYQQVKYLFDATTSTGEDIVIDFMKIEFYREIESMTVPLVQINMSAGTTIVIKGDIAYMKKLSGEIGIPIHFGSISPQD